MKPLRENQLLILVCCQMDGTTRFVSMQGLRNIWKKRGFVPPYFWQMHFSYSNQGELHSIHRLVPSGFENIPRGLFACLRYACKVNTHLLTYSNLDFRVSWLHRVIEENNHDLINTLYVCNVEKKRKKNKSSPGKLSENYEIITVIR